MVVEFALNDVCGRIVDTNFGTHAKIFNKKMDNA